MTTGCVPVATAVGFPLFVLPVRDQHPAEEAALLSTEDSIGMAATEEIGARVAHSGVPHPLPSLVDESVAGSRLGDGAHGCRSAGGDSRTGVDSGLRGSVNIAAGGVTAEMDPGSGAKCGMEVLGSAAQVSAAAMDSLKRKTERVLHISSVVPGREGERDGQREGERDHESTSTSESTSMSDGCGWSHALGYTNIDNNLADPQMCAIYAAEIYQNLQEGEGRHRPGVDFLERVQGDINASMRGILIDWLVEVAEEYKLVSDTLYLTCSYIDRFLAARTVSRTHLQLLGVACMLIAAKYEEIYAPQVDEFCYITDNTYSRDEVLEMERQVLGVLQFDLSAPTTKIFVRRYVKAAQVGLLAPCSQLEFLSNYLSELTLVDYACLRFLPSQLAAAAVFLAKLTLFPSCHPWDSTLQHYTGYSAFDLQPMVVALYDLQCNVRNCTLPAIRDKYRQTKFQSVALIPHPMGLPITLFESS